MTTEATEIETLADAIENAKSAIVPTLARLMREAITRAVAETDWEATAREALEQCHDITDSALVTDSANQAIQSMTFADVDVSA